MDIAGVIFEHGASIAATKKVMLEDHFAMLLSVYTPPDGTAPQTLAEELQSAAVAERLGFTISAKLTDATRKASVDAEANEQRRLKLSSRTPEREDGGLRGHLGLRLREPRVAQHHGVGFAQQGCRHGAAR